MFKKTLIAATVAAMSVSAANAATVAVTSQNVGTEYANLIGQVAAGNIAVTTGIDYAQGDVFSVELSGGVFTATQTDGKTAHANPTAVVTGGGGSGAVSFLEFNDAMTRAQFLVDTAFTTGATITVSGLNVATTGAANKGAVKVGSDVVVDTVIGAITRDTDTAPATLFSYADQISVSIASGNSFDAVVDVNASRELFTSAATSDTLTFTATNAATSLDQAVTVGATTLTVNGDFSFLDDNGDGDIADSGDGTLAVSGGGTVTVAEDLMSATVAYSTISTSGDSFVVTVTTQGDVVIPDQSFTASASVKYTSGSSSATSTELNGASAGSWTLNGANVHVPYYPMGSAFARSLLVSNTSTQAGSVDVTFYVGDDTVTVNNIGTAAAEGLTNLTDALRAAVATAGLSGQTVSFDLTINAPTNDVTVKALYYARADGDRVQIQ